MTYFHLVSRPPESVETITVRMLGLATAVETDGETHDDDGLFRAAVGLDLRWAAWSICRAAAPAPQLITYTGRPLVINGWEAAGRMLTLIARVDNVRGAPAVAAWIAERSPGPPEYLTRAATCRTWREYLADRADAVFTALGFDEESDLQAAAEDAWHDAAMTYLPRAFAGWYRDSGALASDAHEYGLRYDVRGHDLSTADA